MTSSPDLPLSSADVRENGLTAASRADAVRNADLIVETAARVLGEDPGAGMAEVAAAAGLGRATVYRHFKSRDELLEAIRRRAVTEAERSLQECRLEHGDAAGALRRLIAVWLEVSRRYAFPQVAARMWLDRSRLPDRLDESQRLFLEPVAALIERGQAAGEFSRAISPIWAARVIGNLLMAGTRAVNDGVLTPDEADSAVYEALVNGLRG